MIKSLLKDVQVIRVEESVAAGTATTTTDVVDMAGFEGAMFVVTLGTVTATGVTTLKLQQCDTSGGDYADLTGTGLVSTGTTSDEKIMLVEIINPLERYIKLVAVTSVANVGIDSINVFKFGSSKLPITEDDTVDNSEQTIAPVEGTA